MPDHRFPRAADDACLLAAAIVDTVREPLVVLDRDLKILVASRSFYSTFDLAPEATEGLKIYDLDGGVWNIPELQLLLERIVPDQGLMEGYEVEREFPRIGGAHHNPERPAGLLQRTGAHNDFTRHRGRD